MATRQIAHFSEQELVGLYAALSHKRREEGWEALTYDEQDWLDWYELQMEIDDE